MAAPTPIGAKSITMFVNLNMVAARDSARASIGRRFSSERSESAIPKSTLKTTICRTCPSATDLATFSGKAWRMTSLIVCFGAVTPAGCRPSGAWTPTPARVRLMAARPMKRARVVTTSK